MIDIGTKMVWIPDHPEYAWFPGKIIASNQNELVVVDDNQKEFVIKKDGAMEVHPSCLTSAADLLTLGDFNEGSLIHNIRERYKKDIIYTAVGQPIIISINPYKKLDIYSQKGMKKYRDQVAALKLGVNNAINDSHLFQIAENSYQALLDFNKNQSIVISGESGAGKTEAAKIILKYLTQVSASHNDQIKKKVESKEPGIEERVLDSNPILEAFGNAKTVRNDNSSRFGKFIEVYFDKIGKIRSANIINYLLEKSRIVSHQPGERNYHIFYQICYGFNQQEREKYQIYDPKNYTYLSKSDQGNYSANMNDEEEYENTKMCFNVLGFSDAEKDELLKILSAILHIGNIRFVPVVDNNIEGSQISRESIPFISLAGTFLGIEPKNLMNLFCLRQIQVGQDITWKSFKAEEAERNKDALVKEIYGKTFDWLISRVNQSIEKSTKTNEKYNLVLGILDIFGFENFQINSFEQLCINFTNEKLQQHFNNHIFKTEQAEYFAEGVEWKTISFTDNLMTIDLIEKPNNSIFALLEDECLIPKGNDSNFIAKLYTRLNGYSPSPFLPKNNQKPQLFGIRHYAGDIYYDCRNFIEKNKDTVNPDLIKTFSISQNSIIKTIFTTEIQAPKMQSLAKTNLYDTKRRAVTGLKGATLTTKFRNQLNDLIAALNETNPAYVRCIKPNPYKKAGLFDSLDVQRQLRCAGMLEAIRIRKNGFGVRRTHDEFLEKYRILLNKKGKAEGYEDCRRLLERMMNMPELKGIMSKQRGLWALGRTKIFLKEELLVHMDRALYNSIKEFILRAQRGMKKCLFRKRVKRFLKLMRFNIKIKKVIFKNFRRKILEIQKMKVGRRFLRFWKMCKLREKFIAMWLQMKFKDQGGPPIMMKSSNPNIRGRGNHEEGGGGYFRQAQKMAATEKDHFLNIIAKLKEEIEEKTRENEELTKRLESNEPRKTNQQFEDIMKGLTNHYGGTTQEEENKKIKDLEAKVSEYRKKLLEKENIINLVNSKLSYLEKNLETYKNENKYLYEELESKKALYDEKLNLEVQLRMMEEKYNKAQAKATMYVDEMATYKENMKSHEEKIRNMEEELREAEFKYEELKIKYDALSKSEEFFKKEAMRKEQELNDKVQMIKKNENYAQELQSKIQEIKIQNYEKDPNMSMSRDSKIVIDDDIDTDANLRKLQELQSIIDSKNMKIANLTKENQISKEINQTLIKLLKIKTIISEHEKAANDENNANRAESQKNIDKFKMEEKKLLKMLDGLLNKLEAK